MWGGRVLACDRPMGEPTATTTATLAITVNGDARDVPAGLTVAGLLEHLGLGGRRVAVERNRAVVPRAEHATTTLAAGDRLEVVAFVGGG